MRIIRTSACLSIAVASLALVLAPLPAVAQTCHFDTFVDGSLCVGIDCPCGGLSFGFDTIRLQENNLRIKFNDTSAAASFPQNDWQLTANDSANGGVNHFSIDDVTGGRTPFRVEAGAPSFSLMVESTGDVGINTQNPVVELHIVDGNTPTLRLEQDGSSGFTAQTWDIAGNETNFFIRDVTMGSKLPFRIKPGAPTDSLSVAADGDIGLGTNSPSVDLHIQRSDASGTHLLLENTNGTAQPIQIRMQTDSTNRRFMARNASGTVESQIIFGDDGAFTFAGQASPANDVMTIDSSGNVVITGNCSDAPGGGGCTADYVFEPEYELMPLEELAEFVAEKKHLPNVPPASVTKAKGLNLSTMNGRLLEKIEELTLYTLAQQEEIKELRGLVETLRSDG